MPNWKIDLAWIAEIAELKPRTVCECSVGPIDISTSPDFVGKCDRLLLIEPLPRLAEVARKIPGAEVLQVAVGMKAGKGVLLDNNGSSYLDGTWAPTMDRSPLSRIEVEVVEFLGVDDGQIDVLNLDCEGQEWAVISQMRSRPKLLVVEVWGGHPHKEEIFAWLKENEYKHRFSTGPTAETYLYSLCMY